MTTRTYEETQVQVNEFVLSILARGLAVYSVKTVNSEAGPHTIRVEREDDSRSGIRQIHHFTYKPEIPVPPRGTPVRCHNKGVLGYSMGTLNHADGLQVASDPAGKDIMWSTGAWDVLDLDAAERLTRAEELLRRVNTKPIPEDKTLRSDIRNFLTECES